MADVLINRGTCRHSREVFLDICRVSVREVPVLADIGVLDDEIGRPQTLLINVALDVQSPEVDGIGEAVDYTHIVSLAEALGRERTALIETFARRMGEACLEHPLVLRADVLVCKPGALSVGLAAARIVLRKRGSWRRMANTPKVFGAGKETKLFV